MDSQGGRGQAAAVVRRLLDVAALASCLLLAACIESGDPLIPADAAAYPLPPGDYRIADDSGKGGSFTLAIDREAGDYVSIDDRTRDSTHLRLTPLSGNRFAAMLTARANDDGVTYDYGVLEVGTDGRIAEFDMDEGCDDLDPDTLADAGATVTGDQDCTVDSLAGLKALLTARMALDGQAADKVFVRAP